MAKVSNISIDIKELKKNLKTTADLAARQLGEFAKKAQKDLSQKDVAKKLEKLLEAARNAKIEDILSNPQVKKFIDNPKVQEFLNHEKVKEILNNPKLKEVKKRLHASAQSVKSKVKKAAKRKTKKTSAAVEKSAN